MMTNPTEKCIRIFDGFDKESSLLIGSESHDLIFSFGMKTLLGKYGYSTRKVYNNTLSEADNVFQFPDYTSIKFPKGTSIKTGHHTYKAIIGLEVRPPLSNETIDKIIPYLAGLARATKSDFFVFDDREDNECKEIYYEPYVASVTVLPPSKG